MDKNAQCPCGTNQLYSLCCEPYISGKAKPPTAEALMRSRYTAFVICNMAYIKNTTAPETRKEFDEVQAKKWAQQADWKGLQVISSKKGKITDKIGTVEFLATYGENGKVLEHHETSEFKKNNNDTWFFVSGDSQTYEQGQPRQSIKPQTLHRESPKVGRNDPCLCGSGKKYKKCCGASD